jgi:hypothetical protein
MGFLDIEAEASDDPLPAFTVTVFTLWSNEAEELNDIRFITGCFRGDDPEEIIAKAERDAERALCREDGFEFVTSSVVSMFLGEHDNLISDVDDPNDSDSGSA